MPFSVLDELEWIRSFAPALRRCAWPVPGSPARAASGRTSCAGRSCQKDYLSYWNSVSKGDYCQPPVSYDTLNTLALGGQP